MGKTGRVQILKRHMRNVVSASGMSTFQVEKHTCWACVIDVDTMIIARGTPGFSGADLQNMVKYVDPL